MLETLVSVVNFVRTTFYYGLYLSYKTGHVLVNSINAIFKFLVLCLDNLTSFFTVLYESLSIFFQDIFQFIQQILVIVAATIDTIYTSIATVCLKISLLISSVIALISSLYNGIINGITCIITSIGYIFVVLKKLVVLFGSSIWFLITLLPLLLYYLCTLCVSFVHSIYQEICNICYSGVSNVKALIKDTILFIFDVPIESIAGLLIALSLAYVFSQFYILIVAYLKQKLRRFKNWLRRQRMEVSEIAALYMSMLPTHRVPERPLQVPRPRQPVRQAALPQPVRQVALPVQVRGRTPVRTTQEKRENSVLPDDKYCVICQERTKCILLLPCRHLCLCTECIRELRYYNEVCPICRTNIESTMKIFV